MLGELDFVLKNKVRVAHGHAFVFVALGELSLFLAGSMSYSSQQIN